MIAIEYLSHVKNVLLVNSARKAFATGVPVSISVESFTISEPRGPRIRFSPMVTSEMPTEKAISATWFALPCGAVIVICLISGAYLAGEFIFHNG